VNEQDEIFIVTLKKITTDPGNPTTYFRFKDGTWSISADLQNWFDVGSEGAGISGGGYPSARRNARVLANNLENINTLEQGKTLILAAKTEPDNSDTPIRGTFRLSLNNEMYFQGLSTPYKRIRDKPEVADIAPLIKSKAIAWRDSVLSRPITIRYRQDNQPREGQFCVEAFPEGITVDLSDPYPQCLN